jgi:hypothetical protein
MVGGADSIVAYAALATDFFSPPTTALAPAAGTEAIEAQDTASGEMVAAQFRLQTVIRLRRPLQRTALLAR